MSDLDREDQEEPLPDLGRAGIPVGQPGVERPSFRFVLNRRRAVIYAAAALLGLAVGFLGLADEGDRAAPSDDHALAP